MIEFVGNGLDERGVLTEIIEDRLIKWMDLANIYDHHKTRILHNLKARVGDYIIVVDKKYFRPAEVDILLGDATKAKEKLGWEPKETLETLIVDMLKYDLDKSYRELVLKESGFHVASSCGL